MRSCIYCGKELAPGEKCDCAASAEHRRNQGNSTEAETEKGKKNRKSDKSREKKKKNKAKEEKNTDYSRTYNYNDFNRTQYRTGYTHNDGRFKNAFRKLRIKRRVRRAYESGRGGDYFRSGWRSILYALRSPVDAVQNPKSTGMGAMTALWAIQGAVLWLCAFFILTNAPRGPFAMLGNMLAFKGVQGYKTLLYMLLYAVSGAVGGIVMFFMYTGVFYGINRFIFRDTMTPFKSICERLAFTAVPLSAITLVGILISFISSTTLIILLICGAIIFVVLTYEALRTQWVQVPQGKIVYAMMLGFFLLLTLICYVVRFGTV